MTTHKTKLMDALCVELQELKRSPLYAQRIEHNYLPVIGEGSVDAQIMFVGEAPGRNEAKTGKPFCGAAGKILDALLASLNIPRDSIYITNIVKDRPPQNRDPLPEEIAVYGPFLDRQIEIIQPAVIVTLGRYAMEYLMRRYHLETELVPIGLAHGKLYRITFPHRTMYLAPQYHPAAAIYNQRLKPTLFEDFKVLETFTR